jgi:hypothetical protein
MVTWYTYSSYSSGEPDAREYQCVVLLCADGQHRASVYRQGYLLQTAVVVSDAEGRTWCEETFESERNKAPSNDPALKGGA